MIPLARPYIGPEEETAVAEVLRSGWLTQGPRVAEFERAFADYVGASHAVAVSSCTTALHLVMVALGIGPGDEVVCPSLSFIATANSVAHAGARPVFADVDERTFNLTPSSVARALGPRTKAILVAHQIGMPADLDELTELARSRGLHLIEDAACAVGSVYRGSRVGRPHGVAACFSFHPRKVLTTGEGGMITTASGDLAERLRRLRHHGMTISDLERHRAMDTYAPESYREVGYNYRLTDMQAAIGLVQLRRLDEMLRRRRELASRYRRALESVASVRSPAVAQDREPNYQTYMVRLLGRGRQERNRIIECLLALGVQTRPGLMASHREPAWASGPAGPSLAVTEQISDDGLALPLFHQMTEVEQDRVVEAVRACLR